MSNPIAYITNDVLFNFGVGYGIRAVMEKKLISTAAMMSAAINTAASMVVDKYLFSGSTDTMKKILSAGIALGVQIMMVKGKTMPPMSAMGLEFLINLGSNYASDFLNKPVTES